LRSIREEYCVPGAWNEWDAAELSNGDLLCVVRRYAPGGGGRQVRWQGHMRRDGNRWTLAEYGPSPLPHSGHPELRTTREGIVLHIATTGVDWTADAGKSWRPLAFPGMERRYASRYYPDSFQLDDGRIFVFSHNGWDNAYGEFDQSIVMDAFRLTRE